MPQTRSARTAVPRRRRSWSPPRTTFELSRAYPQFRSPGRAISVPQRSRIGHHRATPVGLVNTAELAFHRTSQVREAPKSVSQAENAGSIPVTRSLPSLPLHACFDTLRVSTAQRVAHGFVSSPTRTTSELNVHVSGPTSVNGCDSGTGSSGSAPDGPFATTNDDRRHGSQPVGKRAQAAGRFKRLPPVIALGCSAQLRQSFVVGVEPRTWWARFRYSQYRIRTR